MQLLRRLRKTAGYYKWFYLQGGRKHSAYAREAKRLQKASGNHLNRLPPITLAKESDVEVHTLCGTGQAVMAIYALWSFSHFTDGRFPIVIHSDGTLTRADELRFQRFFPNIRIVHPRDIAKQVEDFLAGEEFEHLRRFRGVHVLNQKLIHPHIACGSKVLLLLDTDILFFSRPDELLERCEAAQSTRVITSGVDAHSGYVGSRETLSTVIDINVVDKHNAGLIVLQPFDRSDFLAIESALRKFAPDWFKNYFAEQTLYGILCSVRGWHQLPYAQYTVGRGYPDSIAIHYCSGLRHRFFTEGVPRVLEIAEGKAIAPQATRAAGRVEALDEEAEAMLA